MFALPLVSEPSRPPPASHGGSDRRDTGSLPLSQVFPGRTCESFTEKGTGTVSQESGVPARPLPGAKAAPPSPRKVLEH